MAKKHQKPTHKKHFKAHRQKKILFGIIILMLISIAFAVDFTPYTKYEYWEISDDATTIFTTSWRGTNFTIGVEGVDADFILIGIALNISKAGAGSFCEVILTDSENPVTDGMGNIISNGSIDTSTIDTSPANWQNITMKEVMLSASTTYTWFANCTGTDPNGMGIRVDDLGEYAGGKYVTSADAGATWVAPAAWDLPFRIFGTVFTNVLYVNLTNPTNNSKSSSSSVNLTSDYNMIGDIVFSNATYRIWYSNGSLLNQSSPVITIPTSNQTSYTIYNLETETYTWNVDVCGINSTGIICSNATSNYTFSLGASEDAYYYPTNVTETAYNTFRLNITTLEGSNLFAARLNYNGTRYIATKTLTDGRSYELIRSIDIPLLTSKWTPANMTFFWEFEYKNGFEGRENSTTYSHEVTPLVLTECNDTYKTIHLVNYTIFNETSLDRANATMDASFEFYLGTGSVKKNNTINTALATSKYSYSTCSNNATQNKVINVSSIINLQDTENSTSFSERTFYFNKEKYSSTTTNQKLYLLDTTLGKSIIVEVTNPGLVPSVGYYVKVYRYYPGVNDYYVIERAKTDEFGQFVARLIEPNTVKYQFEFSDSDNNILKRTADMTIACRTLYCVIPFVIEDTTDDFDRFENVTGFDYSLSFTNATKTFTYTWDDATGDSTRNRLQVERVLFNGTTVLCNQTSTAVSGSLDCVVGSSTASYRAQAFRKVNSEDERRIAVLNIKVGDISYIFGLEGLILAFILLFTLIAVGSFNPTIGVVLYLGGFLALGILNVISFSPIIFIANLIIGVLFIWAFRT